MKQRLALVAAAATLALVALACNTGSDNGGSDLSGSIQIDGSSTVFPISEAVAETFGDEAPDVNVQVGQAGTGGGFTKFCAGETDISDASRPIKDEEKKICDDKGIEFTELKIAIDGLSVVVNKSNDFAECLTIAELKKVWDQGSTVKNWKDVKAGYPDQELKLYGPGADSGTFDYFTETINGEADKSRSDYTQSEDDNILVQGVGGDENALGYFGFSYLEANLDKIKSVAVDGGEGCIQPTNDTIADGSYVPLSRPLFIYVSNEALAREEVQEFTTFYLDSVNDILADVKYIPLPDSDLEASKTTLESAVEAAA